MNLNMTETDRSDSDSVRIFNAAASVLE